MRKSEAYRTTIPRTATTIPTDKNNSFQKAVPPNGSNNSAKNTFRSPRCHFTHGGYHTVVPSSDTELWGMEPTQILRSLVIHLVWAPLEPVAGGRNLRTFSGHLLPHHRPRRLATHKACCCLARASHAPPHSECLWAATLQLALARQARPVRVLRVVVAPGAASVGAVGPGRRGGRRWRGHGRQRPPRARRRGHRRWRWWPRGVPEGRPRRFDLLDGCGAYCRRASLLGHTLAAVGA